MWGQCVRCLGCTQALLFAGQWEEIAAPWLSSSSVLNSQGYDRTCFLAGGPGSDIAQGRPPRGHSLLSSQIKKEKTKP